MSALKTLKEIIGPELYAQVQKKIPGETVKIPWSDTMREERDSYIYEMYKMGKSHLQIAQIFSFSCENIRRIIAKQEKEDGKNG
jgi:Mor family transcriptional regulator